MAEKTNSRNRNEVFWSKMETANGDEDAFVPGITAPGNRRPSRPRCRKPPEVRASVPVHQPVVEDIGTADETTEKPTNHRVQRKMEKPTNRRKTVLKKGSILEDETLSTSIESFAERSIRQLKQASLRDLCPEDKQRVANLIKELARLGEEKEKVVSELHGERENYERQVMTLVSQQENIIREREEIQDKLFQCQKLLTEYQAQLLNKQDRLTTSVTECRQPAAPRRRSTNQNPAYEILTNEKPDSHDPVVDLLTDNKDFRERIKRPFTALIDKEIARERSLSRSSRGSRSRSVSPATGRPHFAYPQNLAGIGPLREPIASSTHKSMEINAQLASQINDPSSPQSSIRGFSIRDHSQRNSQKHSSKVVFNDECETDEFAEKHSPNIKGSNSSGGSFKDPQYAEFYKKLSPAGRRRELLLQRQALLDEQERLKKVLEKQENQLKERHAEYERRRQLQKDRMDFYKEGGKFPALRLDFDGGDSERGGEAGSEVGSLPRETVVVEMEPRGQGLDVRVITPRDGENLDIDGDIQVRNIVSAGTSPNVSPRIHRITTATSPMRTQPPHHNDEDEELPRLIDAATSISYRSPLQDASNRQGNLPLATNRQRHYPSPLVEAAAKPTRNLGEKTLNVLELVNSMEEEPDVVCNYGSPDIENRPHLKLRYTTDHPNTYRQYTSPGNLRTSQTRYKAQSAISPNTAVTSPDKFSSSQDKLRTSQDKLRTSQDKLRTSQDKFRTSQDKFRNSGHKMVPEDEESLEENKILEDVFFL